MFVGFTFKSSVINLICSKPLVFNTRVLVTTVKFYCIGPRIMGNMPGLTFALFPLHSGVDLIKPFY